VRKFVRSATVYLGVTAVSIALVASLWLWAWYRAAQVESFYREHPLLSGLRVREKRSTNYSAAARESLLEVVPLGTDRDAAIAVLLKAGFGCKAVTESAADTELRSHFLKSYGLTPPANDGPNGKGFVDCQAGSPAILGNVHWIVGLRFDVNGRLIDARVAIWNIFL
jgi:hypothetical protein